MRLADAVSPARSITVKFVNDSLHVQYRPMSYTPEQLDQMQAQAASAKDPRAGVESLVDQMVELLVEWDLEDNDGNPIPITKEGLRQVPLNVFTEVMREVGRDQQAGDEGKVSDAG